jgi:RsiW-degrading membrane proteinase PrsW (M82 family)
MTLGWLSSAAKVGVSLLPVFAFLSFLRLLDSYKLLTLRRTLRAIGVGCVVAAACYGINATAFGLLGPAGQWYARFGTPVIEELLKAAYVIWLIRGSRVGFMVDAAISGFAVGAGFAAVENLAYLQLFSNDNPLMWILRGFGTAMMHGGTTAIVGIVASSMAERRTARDARIFVPGLLIAVTIHSAYNQHWLPPAASAVAMLVGLPLALAMVFMQSEESLRKWLGDKLDKDIELLRMISTGQLSTTPAGKYLNSLRGSVAPEVVGDMLCLLQLSLELSARAKGDLLLREAGFPAPPDPSLAGRFKELRYLERSIGPAGRMAMAPLLSRSARELWEMHLLSQGEIAPRASLWQRAARLLRRAG